MTGLKRTSFTLRQNTRTSDLIFKSDFLVGFILIEIGIEGIRVMTNTLAATE